MKIDPVELTSKHSEFLKNEFGIDDVDMLDDDAFYDLYHSLYTIEEIEFANAEESERGDLAADFVTYMSMLPRFIPADDEGIFDD